LRNDRGQTPIVTGACRDRIVWVAGEYNQGLSERRAQSVVDDLVARGFDPAAISAIGFGETMPLISPDDDETSRELNRRVEITCG
jgi:OOP family OmpA-OmpF porin